MVKLISSLNKISGAKAVKTRIHDTQTDIQVMKTLLSHKKIYTFRNSVDAKLCDNNKK